MRGPRPRQIRSGPSRRRAHPALPLSGAGRDDQPDASVSGIAAGRRRAKVLSPASNIGRTRGRTRNKKETDDDLQIPDLVCFVNGTSARVVREARRSADLYRPRGRPDPQRNDLRRCVHRDDAPNGTCTWQVLGLGGMTELASNFGEIHASRAKAAPRAAPADRAAGPAWRVHTWRHTSRLHRKPCLCRCTLCPEHTSTSARTFAPSRAQQLAPAGSAPDDRDWDRRGQSQFRNERCGSADRGA